MSLNVEFLEDGEIESDTDDLPKCRKSTSASDVRENGHDRVNGDAAKSEERTSRQSRRKRRRDSRERSGSREKTKSSLPMDPVEIAEMDEYEMLCIRGASPPLGNPFSTMDETYQPHLEKTAASTFYEYERDYRYDSDDDGYSKRRGSPPHKRRRERGRRRHRPNKRSPDRRDRRRRSNSADDQDGRDERKMEICKFYLLDCCVKRSICKYMHSEFPCKYFHLGLECQHEKPCKFSHGKALSEEMTHALARHVAAAPKAILGNFKRYSRDKALIMIQAKNRQLNEENGIAGKDTLPNEKESKSNKKSSSSSSKRTSQSQQDISAIFTAQQIEKLTALGVTNLQQVKEMSLAQLTDIGMSLNQIGELQKIAENGQKYSDLPLVLLCKPQQDEVVEANAPKGDMDMRRLLPMLPTTNNTVNDPSLNRDLEEDSNIGSEGALSPPKEDHQQPDICLEEKPSEHESSQDSSLSFVDDEPELVIDESIDTSEGQLDSDHIKSETVANFYSSSSSSLWDTEQNDSRTDKRSSPTSSEEELLNSISFEDAFEPLSFYSENKENNIQTAQTKSPQKEKEPEKGPVLSDFDMRLPFADVIANYVPAMEIDASIRSHLGIKYKLIEILLPEKKDPAIRPENIPESTLDPRLKKLLSSRSTKVESSSPTSRTDKKSTMTFVNPYKVETQSTEISVDPRKRKEQTSESHPKPIQQNFNYVLNSFLQKSKWYQNLNSKLKMEINQHLADLTSELNKFSQLSSRDKVFQISTLGNATHVSEILSEIGLEINKDGIIQERKTPSTPEPKEFNLPPVPEVFSNDIPSLLNMGSNQNFPISNSTFTQNTPILSNNIMPVIPPIPHQRFEFPKPGLLGIAPGIEGPQLFLHPQNNGPNFNNNGMNPVIWNDPPPNFVHQTNLPKRCPGMEDMNRNPFAVKMGKRWSRKPGAKKQRRI